MSQLVFEVVSTDIDERRGKSRSTQRDYCIRSQNCYVSLIGDKFPEKCTINLGETQKAYAVGFYTLDPKSFYIGDFKSLAVRPVLNPAQGKRS